MFKHRKPANPGILIFLLIGISIASNSRGQSMIDFSNASIYVSKSNQNELQSVIEVLQEEVEKRTGILWELADGAELNDQPQVIIGFEIEQKELPQAWQRSLSELDDIGFEGYQLIVLQEQKKAIIQVRDRRGALYGVGKLLRKMEMRTGEVKIPQNLKLDSTPKYTIRGHQLGYRPKTNSYDAWSPAQFDQYIRELAIFGANSIEIVPPRTDDDLTSQHMQIPAIEMIAEQSRICEKYDVDVWLWYPNMDTDYTQQNIIKKELEERHEVFSRVSRLDHLFVPGGDPGDVEPDLLFDWLEQVAVVLLQYHPNAKIWISPQVFRPNQAWFDKFYNYINQEPGWLGGVVFGPWVKPTIQEIREKIKPGIPIRRYPDITHSLSSQYPIPRWDLAQAITLGRECINPRPRDEKVVHNAFDEYANGSLSYSEGTNDDVNKFIWSDQDWDPGTPVIETLRDYARFFISPDHTEEIAHALLALEENVRGSLLVNEHVQKTLWQWQDIEATATEGMKSNFRYQMGLIRAYFDAHIQKRLIYETDLERQAREYLATAKSIGATKAMALCKETLSMARTMRIDTDSRQKCFELADSLYASIGAQLTVEQHGAVSGRGNFIDLIDNPLNDIKWIKSELKSIEKLNSEEDKVNAIETLLKRNNPGPGGFYDNFGNPQSWGRVLNQKPFSVDPGNLSSPRVSFGVCLKDKEWVHEITAKGFDGVDTPFSWMNQVTTLYDEPLQIYYNELDPKTAYTVKVAYTGRFKSRMKMMADDILVHDFIKTGIQPIYEFPIPQEALQDGEVTFSWTCGEGERGSQVSEIWIIRSRK